MTFPRNTFCIKSVSILVYCPIRLHLQPCPFTKNKQKDRKKKLGKIRSLKNKMRNNFKGQQNRTQINQNNKNKDGNCQHIPLQFKFHFRMFFVCCWCLCGRDDGEFLILFCGHIIPGYVATSALWQLLTTSFKRRSTIHHSLSGRFSKRMVFNFGRPTFTRGFNFRKFCRELFLNLSCIRLMLKAAYNSLILYIQCDTYLR